MLTRCPACTTIFRVHPEQLKARQGKVRCGACQGVFNALDSLIEEIAAPPAEPVQAPAEALAEPPSAVAVASAATIAVPPAPTLEDRPEPGGGDALVVDIGDVEPLRPTIIPDTELLAVAESGASAADAETADEASADPAFEPALHEEADAGARFGWFWAGGIVVAIVALLLQGLLHYRVELATLVPASRPWFAAACEPLGCRVDLPRKIELLAIESSDMNPDAAFPSQPNRLRLHASLRNRAPFAQEWPALELTLTDTGDRPLIRRVLSAADYLRAAPTAGIAAQQEVGVDLALDTGALVASGYRIYLFYP